MFVFKYSILSLLLLLIFSADPCLARLSREDAEEVRAIALKISGVGDVQFPVGTIIPYAGVGAVPAGFVECDGRQLPKIPPAAQAAEPPAQAQEPAAEVAAAVQPQDRNDYRALYAVISDTYTPEAERAGTHFRVPDLRGRVPMGSGQGAGLAVRATGATVGAETHTLSVAEMPAHAHGVHDPGHAHGVHDPGHAHNYSHRGTHGDGGFRDGDNRGGEFHMGTHGAHTGIGIHPAATGVAVQATGGGGAHNNIQPSLVIRYLIKWKGGLHAAQP